MPGRGKSVRPICSIHICYIYKHDPEISEKRHLLGSIRRQNIQFKVNKIFEVAPFWKKSFPGPSYITLPVGHMSESGATATQNHGVVESPRTGGK